MNKNIDRTPILGAVFGDLVGSRFQLFPIKTKNFKLITKESHFTDDTIMTLAIEKAVKEAKDDFNLLSKLAVKYMRKYYLLYPALDYGLLFKEWLTSDNPKPYGSFGNGGAMRVSACGVYYDKLEDSLKCAEAVTKVTHNHPEGMKAALATTKAIYLARNGYDKEYIKNSLEKEYNLNFKLEEIRKEFKFNSKASYTMPAALACFLESNSFIDAIRNAVSLGGDSDTICAITGSVASSCYGLNIKVSNFVKKTTKNIKI